MTQDEARQKITQDQWQTDWDHPQILEELLADPPSPTTAEVLYYDFDTEDSLTMDILITINGTLLEQTMRSHVLGVKNQEKSRMHPKFSPFTLKYHDKDNNKIVAFNCKGDRAHTFKHTDLRLEDTSTNFDLFDRTTYLAICSLGPSLLWDTLKDLQMESVDAGSSGTPPYCIITQSNKNNHIIFVDKQGLTWDSSLSITSKHTDTTNTIAQRGVKRPTQAHQCR